MKKTLLILLFIVQFSFGQSYTILNQAEGRIMAFQPLYDNYDLFGYIELREMNIDENFNVTCKYTVLDKNMNRLTTGEFSLKKLNDKQYNLHVKDLNYANGVIRVDFFHRYKYSPHTMDIPISREVQVYAMFNIKTNEVISSRATNPDIIETTFKFSKKDVTTYDAFSLDSTGFLICENKRKESKKDPINQKFYAINGIDKKIWEFNGSKVVKNHFLNYAVAYYDSDYIILKGWLSKGNKKNDLHYLILDSKTGKEIYFSKIPINYTHKYNYAFVREHKAYLGGKYYKKDKNEFTDYDESLGIFQHIFDLKLNIDLVSKYVPYDQFKDISINKNGKVRGEGFIDFKRTNINPDGTFFILAESYWEKTQYRAYNQLYTFRMDKDFNPIKTSEYDVKRTRGYKYDFSQRLPDKSGRAYFFFDKNDAKDLELNIINYYFKSKKEVIQKIAINNDKSAISIFPAKEGYVGIAEYFKDPKKEGKYMEIRLEKLNFERE
ncbi:DUF6770 family protein [Flavobacterium crassostreae]|nr:DUF6770 family protein [Flavobacterium crassostreae]